MASQVQYHGQHLICAKADVATIRSDEGADHSDELTSVSVAISAAQVTDEPTYAKPYQGVKNGALSYVVTLAVNDLTSADSLYRKMRNALISNTTLVLYSTMDEITEDKPISATNEEFQCEFVPPASAFGWTPGAKRSSTITFTADGGSVVFNETPPT